MSFSNNPEQADLWPKDIMSAMHIGSISEEEANAISWPETMWPLDVSILVGLPKTLAPSIKELEALEYPWQFLALMKRIMIEKISVTKIADSAKLPGEKGQIEIVGPVWIDEGVQIRAYTSLTGPLYIGKNTFIGNGAVISQSLVMQDSTIGHACEVNRSFLGSGTQTSHFNTALDSVFGQNVHLAGRSGTANLRLDKQPVKVNINGTLIPTDFPKLGAFIGRDTEIGPQNHTWKPGTRIGQGCIIYPNINLYSDLPNFTILKQPLTRRK